MMNLILSIAENDDQIRTVIMKGSRVNPNVKKDFFQDYDIVYIVKDIKSFTDNHCWINQFGELMILQMPETIEIIPPANNGCFSYLMQFSDGSRIDLTLVPVEKAGEIIICFFYNKTNCCQVYYVIIIKNVEVVL